MTRAAAAAPAAAAIDASEAALAARWAAGERRPLRLEDGRALRVIFPGVPGGGAGPDFTGAVLDAGGDILRGDVELHLRASGWAVHGHAADPAYARVVLHAVARNDTGALVTRHASGRAIPVVVIPAPAGQAAFPPPFTPPCALRIARGEAPAAVLARLGLRRLRMKAARAQPLVAASGPGQALHQLGLEVLGGSANRVPFAALARRLPLAALLERAAGMPDRPLALAAALKGEAAVLVLQRAGLRPMAAPGRRLDAAGALWARLWPGTEPCWPAALAPNASIAALRAPGIGRASAIEFAVNAVLPTALAAGLWSEDEAAAALAALPSPGTYGRLRRLEGWLARPFTTAAALQGGLLLHADYCTRGACGRCPLS